MRNITKRALELIARAWIAVFFVATTATVSADNLGVYTFDERGTYTWKPDPTLPDSISGPGTNLAGGGIQYPIPFPIIDSEVGKTYGWFEPGTTNLSDIIHFDDSTHFSFYSEKSDPTDVDDPPDPADWQQNVNLRFLAAEMSWTIIPQGDEQGPEGNNYLEIREYRSDGQAVLFHGISDIPEPTTLVLLPAGVISLLAYRCRKGK